MNKIMGILMLLVYIFFATVLLSENFGRQYNVEQTFKWSALHAIPAIGAALVIITGGIDLSIGSLISLTGSLLAILVVDHQYSIGFSVTTVLLCSSAIGLIHGLLITKLKLQPFVVTLCGLLIYRGIAREITEDQVKGFGTAFNDSLRLLVEGKPFTMAFLLLTGGLLMVLWAGKNAVLSRDVANRELPRNRRFRVDSVVSLALMGALLTGIGASRYVGPYEDVTKIDVSAEGERTETVISQATVEAAARPANLMKLCGWLVIPATLWLVYLLITKQAFSKMLGIQLGMVVLAAGAVGLATQYGESVDTEGTQALFLYSATTVLVLTQAQLLYIAYEFFALRKLQEKRVWTLLGLSLVTVVCWVCSVEGWIPIIAVFVTLGALMALIGWFAKSVGGALGADAAAPLKLIGLFSLLFLIGHTEMGQTPIRALIFPLVILGTAAATFLNKTIYGRYLLALGANVNAARFSGVNTDRMTILAYVICSTVAGIAGILFALETNSVQPLSHGNFYELYAIAAGVLGGCSLRGGEGNILGVIIGATLMRVILNSSSMLGFSNRAEFLIIGVVILIGVIADEIVRRVVAAARLRESQLADVKALGK